LRRCGRSHVRTFLLRDDDGSLFRDKTAERTGVNACLDLIISAGCHSHGAARAASTEPEAVKPLADFSDGLAVGVNDFYFRLKALAVLAYVGEGQFPQDGGERYPD